MAYVKTEWVNGASGNTPINATNLNNIENGIETNDTNITSLINDVYYKANDTFTCNGYVTGGYVSGGTRQFEFALVTDKSMKNITSITIDSCTVIGRTTSGAYLDGKNSGITKGDSGYTFTAVKSSNKTFYVNILKSSAFTNVSNNTPVNARISSISVTFS